jgi:hypothetical protein
MAFGSLAQPEGCARSMQVFVEGQVDSTSQGRFEHEYVFLACRFGMNHDVDGSTVDSDIHRVPERGGGDILVEFELDPDLAKLFIY